MAHRAASAPMANSVRASQGGATPGAPTARTISDAMPILSRPSASAVTSTAVPRERRAFEVSKPEAMLPCGAVVHAASYRVPGGLRLELLHPDPRARRGPHPGPIHRRFAV